MADLIWCPRCSAPARVVGRDVLTGDDVLKCDGWLDCGWTSADGGEEPARIVVVGPRLFGEAS